MTKAPTILLPYQAESISIAEQNDLSVFEKSRRIGLSYGFSSFAVLKAAAARGAQNVYYIGYNLDMAREFIGYCADFAKVFDKAKVSLPPDDAILEAHSSVEVGPGQTVESGNIQFVSGGFLFLDGSTKGVKTLRIDFPNGKSVAALPSTPRAVRGKQGIFIIDEAAFHDDLEGLIKAVLAALMWGGKVIIISTHDGAENYFNELIESIRSGRRAGYAHRITLADALAAGLYKRISLVQGKAWSQEAEAAWEANLRKTYGDAAEEELDVIPARGSGRYMSRATIEAACSDKFPVLRLAQPKEADGNTPEWLTSWIDEWLDDNIKPLIAGMDASKYSYFGQDFARSSDLSVVAVGQFNELANLECHFILEMRDIPFRQQKQVLDYIVGKVPRFSSGKMDARGNGQQMAEDMASDWGEDRIECVMASAKTYLAMMPRLRARIEDQQITIPKSDGVIEDLRLIKLVKGVPMIVDHADDKADGSKNRRHGDAAIALMHFVAAADSDFGPFEYAAPQPEPPAAGLFGEAFAGSNVDDFRMDQGFNAWE
jgi:phage FluMu gp28-like protein